MPTEHILIVDDEEAIREVVSTLLESQGYHCTPAANGLIATNHLKKNLPDLVLSDMVMPEMDGLKLLEWIRNHDKDIPVIMVTAMHDLSTALDAIRCGAYDYILKPFEKDQLYMSVRRALEHRRLLLENRNYQRNLEKLVDEQTAKIRGTLQQLESSYDDTLEALGGALDLKDAETEGHWQARDRIHFGDCEGPECGPGAASRRLPVAPFFTTSRQKWPSPIKFCRKPGPLTPEEQEIMRTHCAIGYEMLSRVPFLRDVAKIVYLNSSGTLRRFWLSERIEGARTFRSDLRASSR